MSDDATANEFGVVPCSACIAGELPECCTDEHTPAAVRLAEAIGRALAGPPGHPEAHPEWYIEDAAAIIGYGVAEGDGWVVETGSDGALTDADGYFKVNGTEFYLDVNAEGFNTPELGAAHRRWLAEEWGDDDDE